MARVGIVGLANTGKTTLFNALTGLSAPAAPHPFSTSEPNVGVARVPDDRLDRIATLERSDKVTPATLDLIDLPAMAGGGGLGSQFLGRLREVEALAVVLRAFHDESVPDEESGTDPVAQAETMLIELAVADAEVFGRRAERAEKEATADPGQRPAADAYRRAVSVLDDGRALRAEQWSDVERAAFRDLAPLTLKPAVWVVNIDEGAGSGEMVGAVQAIVPAGDTVVALSARIESEAAELDPRDRIELLEGLGLGAGALATVVAATHRALGVLSFFTTGPKESRAWTVRAGARAPEAAGKIHSDLERGFIRAEIAAVGDVLEAGGWDAAKRAGRVRVEGKDYEVAEGDVMVVRFSV